LTSWGLQGLLCSELKTGMKREACLPYSKLSFNKMKLSTYMSYLDC
jgi:hypothetical protein